MWSWKAIVQRPGGLGTTAVGNLDQHFRDSETRFRQAASDYRNGGHNYDAINPDILDGILLEMLDDHGLKMWFDLFSTFLPATDPLPVALDTKEKQATWFVAAMSASCGQDLRALFGSQYGFPIDAASWPSIYAAVAARVAGRTWVPVGVEEPAASSPRADPRLSSAPNPFGKGTRIQFLLHAAGPANVTVYDLGGRRVRVLVDGPLAPGPHSVTWDGRDDAGRRLASGAYVVRLAAGASTAELKLVFVR
jgi:hypothetical protein